MDEDPLSIANRKLQDEPGSLGVYLLYFLSGSSSFKEQITVPKKMIWDESSFYGQLKHDGSQQFKFEMVH